MNRYLQRLSVTKGSDSVSELLSYISILVGSDPLMLISWVPSCIGQIKIKIGMARFS